MIEHIIHTPALLAITCIAWLGFSLTIAGWFYAYSQGEFPHIAHEEWRDDLGWAILLGVVYGALLPLGCILALLVTGFAKHGWSLKPYGCDQAQLGQARALSMSPNAKLTDAGAEPYSQRTHE